MSLSSLIVVGNAMRLARLPPETQAPDRGKLSATSFPGSLIALDSLYILIPLAVIFVIVAIALFFWAVDNGQFDDMEGPAHSILFDDKPREKAGTH